MPVASRPHNHHQQRHLAQQSSSSSSSSSNLPGNCSRLPTSGQHVTGVPSGSLSHSHQCSSCSLKQAGGSCVSGSQFAGTLLTHSSYLNESKFCSWGSSGSSSNTNSFDNNNEGRRMTTNLICCRIMLFCFKGFNFSFLVDQ